MGVLGCLSSWDGARGDTVTGPGGSAGEPRAGLNTVLPPAQETWYWAGSPDASEVLMSGVRCSGTELALQQCQRHGPVHCPSGGGRFSAGVSCTAREYLAAHRAPVLLPGHSPAWPGWCRLVATSCVPTAPIRARRPGPGDERAAGAGDCLPGGPAAGVAVLRPRGALPVPLGRQYAVALRPPPPAALLLPDPQPGQSRLPTPHGTARLDLAPVPPVGALCPRAVPAQGQAGHGGTWQPRSPCPGRVPCRALAGRRPSYTAPTLAEAGPPGVISSVRAGTVIRALFGCKAVICAEPLASRCCLLLARRRGWPHAARPAPAPAHPLSPQALPQHRGLHPLRPADAQRLQGGRRAQGQLLPGGHQLPRG